MIEEVDKVQDRVNANYHRNVVQPQIEKTLIQLERERATEIEAKERMDKATAFVQ